MTILVVLTNQNLLHGFSAECDAVARQLGFEDANKTIPQESNEETLALMFPHC
jgi:hypothetical protein